MDNTQLRRQTKLITRGNLSKDLAKQLEDPSFSDWTLVCKGEKIPCHRFMLASRSPVFKVMFEQEGFLESKTHQTQIKVQKASEYRNCLNTRLVPFWYSNIPINVVTKMSWY